MCVTRVAKVVSVEGEKARVKFEDGALRVVDVSMVDAKKGAHVEVFADQAISTLSAAEAAWKKRVWSDLRKSVEATSH